MAPTIAASRRATSAAANSRRRQQTPSARPTALVTGGARRIGAAIARSLARDGWDVVVHHRSSTREAKAVAADCGAFGAAAWTIRADLRRPDGVIARAAAVAGRPIDLLVNNASSYAPATMHELSWSGLADAVRVDAWAPFVLMRDLARQPARPAGAKRRGAGPDHGERCVVNLLDARIVDDDPRHMGYLLAKQMLHALTLHGARAFAPLRVNAVAPGAVLPPDGLPGALDRARDVAPLRRGGSPDDIADAVVFLARARSVTGQVVFVDGGRHLGRAAAPPP